MSLASITVTPGMLRADNATFSSREAVTTNAFLPTGNFAKMLANSFVYGASNANASSTTKLSSTILVDKADLIAKRRTFFGNL